MCTPIPDTILRWYRRLIAKKYDGSTVGRLQRAGYLNMPSPPLTPIQLRVLGTELERSGGSDLESARMSLGRPSNWMNLTVGYAARSRIRPLGEPLFTRSKSVQ